MSLVNRMRFPCWVVTVMLALWFNLAEAGGDLLAEIQDRGTLLVGVKSDVPCWGELDKTSGEIVGLEPDLARDLAERLGVDLKLIPVLSAERVSALETRQVDVVIATLNATPERRAQLTLVSPFYYESGAGLLARRSEGFKHWSELRNRRICSRRGSFYNRPIAVEYGADIVALYSADIALAALRDGRCDGFLGDTAVFAVMLQDRELAARYEMILPALYPTGWAVALHRDARGGRLEAAISEAIVHWHRSGLLGRLEEKWGIPRSDFSRRMEAEWRQAAPESDPEPESR
ncbi:transporter substrate-binding domain-containing protein [Thiocystis violascens]|uniref:Amino acid ABC transporter substrate-binding protein, PAAT family n=1 Tax=Thiocystis violascens (strain ATCC 17096 / DSM 198 / 6111) TaxID=765911 RepID=I3YFZ7_THIV6|nr:transporter substrate-binding domain-containing protein [Thiocystis violascens]AFL75915.1 amino acid ABC transporter substrate-binding protein, PAAT family [Thiocystis violascens DSM 198]